MTKILKTPSPTVLNDTKLSYQAANAAQHNISSHKPTAIVFAYHNIGCIGINALLEAEFHIQMVFTHIDDINETQFFDSVAELAAQHDLPIFAANNINHPLWIERAKTLAPDFIFSFYYRDILNEEMLSVARYGAFNLHGSLLPKFRGCAPANWVIIEGETQTGVTLHKMVAQCDAGDIVAQVTVDITLTDTAFSLHQKLASAAESLLKNTLPTIVDQSYSVTKQDDSIANYYGRRTAKEGEIDWQQNALCIHNLVRAVTQPFPGAFTYLNGKKLILWETELIETQAVNRLTHNLGIKFNQVNTIQDKTAQNHQLEEIEPGTIICTDPLIIACAKAQPQLEPQQQTQLQHNDFNDLTDQHAKDETVNYQTTKSQFLLVTRGQIEGGLQLNGRRLAQSLGLVPKLKLGVVNQNRLQKKTRILILGVNGFIGNHLTERLLKSPNYEVYGMDISHNAIKRFINHPRFHFVEGDITIHTEWIAYHIKKCDVILPLVAIATPIQYTKNPLRVFELDFEENLKIIRHCVKYQKRVIFPSTSEVYGMCDDPFFDENHSRLIVGPIHKQRWIYSTSKQLLDRIIWAYGQSAGLKFTLFRPFNWMGPRLDSLDAARVGSSRVITQLILNLVEGTPIKLVDGGEQKRCFTDIKDGIEALFRIIENEQNLCDGQIINIGNPENEASIKTLAECLVNHFNQHPLRNQFPPVAGFKAIDSFDYYGEGYEDVSYRKPSIKNAQRLLNWQPKINLDSTIESTLDYFLQTAFSSMPSGNSVSIETRLTTRGTEPHAVSNHVKAENSV